MRTLLPLTSATLVAVIVLSGCLDPKAPKAPPKVPEPKAAETLAPVSMHVLHVPVNVPGPSASTQA